MLINFYSIEIYIVHLRSRRVGSFHAAPARAPLVTEPRFILPTADCLWPNAWTTPGFLYLPVLFEDFADPIISGREEIGFPKVFSSIDVNKLQESHYVSTSWRGAIWGRMTLTGLKEAKHDPEQSTTASPTDE